MLWIGRGCLFKVRKLEIGKRQSVRWRTGVSALPFFRKSRKCGKSVPVLQYRHSLSITSVHFSTSCWT